MVSPLHRRDFHKAALATAAATAAPVVARAGRVLGANDRVRVGCIGVGNRGVQVLEAFVAHKDAQIVALADVYEHYLNNEYAKADPRIKNLGNKIPRKQPDFGGPVDRYKDFRRIIERKDIDAVIVATPDHWHAIPSMMACDTGKDVYVEKPMTIAVKEGRRMVEAARRNSSIVQCGTQKRSSKAYIKLAEIVQSGEIGKVTVARAYHASNMTPDGIGKLPDSNPPEGLDWDMWLGPRSERPYNQNLAPYKFRWWHLYSSQNGNWGVHYFDVMRWMVGEVAPTVISAHGGNYVVPDSRTIPDTCESIFEFPSGLLMIFGMFEGNGHPGLKSGEIEIRGTKGTVFANERRFEIIPERNGQFQTRTQRCKAQVFNVEDQNVEQDHVRNFLDCVKSRQRPNADVEEGHRSTSLCLLANIALATKSRLEWDGKAETFTNNSAANELLDYGYRQPWSHV
jgi:predicted dehydrogenase